MILFGKTVDNVALADIQRLIEDGVRESKTLEYKEALPSGSDEDKREFLADVSSFANTSGGVIVYGLSEARDKEGNKLGFPLPSIKGLEKFSADDDIRRLENILRSGLDPPINSLIFNSLEVEGKTVLLLGIGRSLFAPHMVDHKNHTRFYSRANTSKQQMSIDELRRAFLELNSWEVEAQEFRAARIQALFGDPLVADKLLVEAPLITHIVPLGSRANKIDLKVLPDRVGHLPSYIHGFRFWFDIDGFVAHFPDPKLSHYLRFFRSGVVESYNCSFVGLNRAKEKILDARGLEKDTFLLLQNILPILSENNISPPYGVFLTLDGIKGHRFTPPQGIDERRQPPAITRDTFLVPGIILDGSSPNEVAMKPAFDILWQGAGWVECPGYDSRHIKK